MTISDINQTTVVVRTFKREDDYQYGTFRICSIDSNSFWEFFE